MIRSYFDLDEMGTLEEPVAVTFTTASFSLGRAVASRTREGEPAADVVAGGVATLPLWAAEALRRGGHVSVQVAAPFHLAVFREFKADPLASSLRAKSPYYYDAGLRLCRLVGNPTAGGGLSVEGSRLAAQLLRLYQLRYMRILRSGAKRGFDLNDVREKLTVSEGELLDGFLNGVEAERRWYTRLI